MFNFPSKCMFKQNAQVIISNVTFQIIKKKKKYRETMLGEIMGGIKVFRSWNFSRKEISEWEEKHILSV